MPGWGLSVLLPQAVGLRQAREMSFTGNFVTAHQALRWGLANHVVAHEELMTFCRQLAADIISNDQAGVRQLRATYAEIAESTGADGWEIERRDAKAWRKRTFDPAEVERRRAGIVERGRSQN
jgi:enoyl-CoA hydratase